MRPERESPTPGETWPAAKSAQKAQIQAFLEGERPYAVAMSALQTLSPTGMWRG